MLTLATDCPTSPVRPASEPSPLVVELMLLRQRMVRDLEQFLSIELRNPGPAPKLLKSRRSVPGNGISGRQ